METKDRKAKIQTYLLNLHNGNIRGNAMEVLEYIHRNSGCTIADLRRELHMPHQTASSALSNLMDSGIVYDFGTEQIEDCVYSKLYFCHEAEKQDQLAFIRQEEKFRQWVKKGLKEFDDNMSLTLKDTLKNETV